eukprot:8169-Pleurochrysis_carterae.AAC.1
MSQTRFAPRPSELHTSHSSSTGSNEGAPSSLPLPPSLPMTSAPPALWSPWTLGPPVVRIRRRFASMGSWRGSVACSCRLARRSEEHARLRGARRSRKHLREARSPKSAPSRSKLCAVVRCMRHVPSSLEQARSTCRLRDNCADAIWQRRAP